MANLSVRFTFGSDLMKNVLWWVGLSLFVVLSIGAEPAAQDADDWYQNHYAPLWKESPWEKAEEALAFYDQTLGLHPPEGPAVAVSSRAWLFESLEEWKSDGWLGSVVAEYRSDQLNPSTVVFKVKWLDTYVDGEEEFSCGWYMADLDSGGWAFTQYAEIDCAKHQL